MKNGKKFPGFPVDNAEIVSVNNNKKLIQEIFIYAIITQLAK